MFSKSLRAGHRWVAVAGCQAVWPPHRARRLCVAARRLAGSSQRALATSEAARPLRSREGPTGHATRRRLPNVPLPTKGVGCAQAIGGRGVWGCGELPLQACAHPDPHRGVPPRVGQSPTPPPEWGTAPLHAERTERETEPTRTETAWPSGVAVHPSGPTCMGHTVAQRAELESVQVGRSVGRVGRVGRRAGGMGGGGWGGVRV